MERGLVEVVLSLSLMISGMIGCVVYSESENLGLHRGTLLEASVSFVGMYTAVQAIPSPRPAELQEIITKVKCVTCM